MKNLDTPYIPDSLAPYWDEQSQHSYEYVKRNSIEDIMASSGELDSYDIGDEYVAFVDMHPTTSYDEKTAIVMGLPYGNGWDENMAIRSRLIQDSLNVPSRMVVFPNNNSKQRGYNLKPEELQKVSEGDFAPIAERQIRVLKNIGIERINLVGYSQAASIGASALKLAFNDFKIGPSGLFEWPNGIDRTPDELKKAFKGKGFSGLLSLNTAIRHSALPALTEAQLARGVFDLPRQLAKFAMIEFRDSKIPENSALHHGMATSGFAEDLTAARQVNPDLEILLAAGQKSLITPDKAIQSVVQSGFNPEKIRIVEGYGHELGDNVVALQILAKMAIENIKPDDRPLRAA